MIDNTSIKEDVEKLEPSWVGESVGCIRTGPINPQRPPGHCPQKCMVPTKHTQQDHSTVKPQSLAAMLSLTVGTYCHMHMLISKQLNTPGGLPHRSPGFFSFPGLCPTN